MVVSFGTQFRTRAAVLLAVLAVAALAVPTPSFAQTPTFNTFLSTYKGDPNYAHPNFSAVGDFNGDGKLDAFVTDGTGTLHFLQGNGFTFTLHNIDASVIGGSSSSVVSLNPVFAPYLPHPVDGYSRIKSVDVNGDGKLDLIVTMGVHLNFAPLDAVTVLINTGNDTNGVPQFTVTHYFSNFQTLRSLTVGDLNGDGKPDFIVGNAGGVVVVYKNNGDGSFTVDPNYFFIQPSNGGPSVGPGVIADLDGDGKADYVVTSNQAGATDIFFRNGDGTFQTTPLILPNYATSIAVADVNGDGKVDLLAVEYGTPNQLVVYLNTGGGSFSAPTRYSTGGTAWNGWTAVATADMNGDGKLDVVVANAGSNNVAVLLGDGSGTFGAPALFTVNVTPIDMAVGDFNGDGKPDVATVGFNDDTFGVLLNTTVAGDTTPPVITAPANITAEATGPAGAAVSFTATAHDDVDGAVTVTANPPSGSPFPLGTTTVQLSASDAAHNTATASFTITVRDTTPPSLNSPLSITFEATGPSGAVVTYAISATDLVDGSVSVTCAPLSGAMFALGTTQVSCSATDAHGNKASGNFPVTVSDTKAPVATASLVAVRAGGDDESTQSFRVVFSATDLVGVKTLSASLNGITVTNGQIVQLKIIKSGAQRTKRDDGRLQIQATAFTLTVTAADAAGNTGSATAGPVFVKNGKDDDDRKHDDESNGKDHRKG